MAFETKVLLMAMAQMALRTNSQEMYEYIAELANVEGVVLKSWDDARAKLEAKMESQRKQ